MLTLPRGPHIPEAYKRVLREEPEWVPIKSPEEVAAAAPPSNGRRGRRPLEGQEGLFHG